MARIFITLCILAFLAACQTREAELLEGARGTVTCKLNGKEWTRLFPKGYQWVTGATLNANRGENCTNQYAEFVSSLSDKSRTPQYELYLARIPLTPGKYPVAKHAFIDDCKKQMPQGIFNTGYQGDLPGSTYYSIPASGTYVSVESYDEKSKVVKGSFEMVAVLAEKGYGNYLPADTLYFTEGRFEIRLKD